MERVETGVVQFEDDWPGVFIRGDNAAFLAMQIRLIEREIVAKPIVGSQPFVAKAALNSLIRLLESSNMGSGTFDATQVQKITRRGGDGDETP